MKMSEIDASDHHSQQNVSDVGVISRAIDDNRFLSIDLLIGMLCSPKDLASNRVYIGGDRGNSPGLG